MLATLGNPYNEKGSRARATELFGRALEQQLDLTEARVPLARIHLDRGDASGAIGVLEQALRLRGVDPRVLNLLASCESELGNVPGVIEYLERSLELLPDQDDAREHLKQLKSVPGEGESDP